MRMFVDNDVAGSLPTIKLDSYTRNFPDKFPRVSERKLRETNSMWSLPETAAAAKARRFSIYKKKDPFAQINLCFE